MLVRRLVLGSFAEIRRHTHNKDTNSADQRIRKYVIPLAICPRSYASRLRTPFGARFRIWHGEQRGFLQAVTAFIRFVSHAIPLWMASTSHLLARFEGAHGSTVSILANDSSIRLCKTEHFESISVLVLNDESNERRIGQLGMLTYIVCRWPASQFSTLFLFVKPLREISFAWCRLYCVRQRELALEFVFDISVHGCCCQNFRKNDLEKPFPRRTQ